MRSLIKVGLGPGRDGNRRAENMDVINSLGNLRLAVRASDVTNPAGGKSMGSITDGGILDRVVGSVGMKEAAAGMTHLLSLSCWRESLPGATNEAGSSQDRSNLGAGPDDSRNTRIALAGVVKWEMVVDVRFKVVDSVRDSGDSASLVVFTKWLPTIPEAVKVVNMAPLIDVAEKGCSERQEVLLADGG